MYRRYEINVRFNGIPYSELWIDPHYEEKHKGSIDDELIQQLVQQSDNWLLTLNAKIQGFEFYEVDGEYDGKTYRLILVVPPNHEYLGVRNAYRRSK